MPVKHIYQVEKPNNKYKNFYFAIFLDTHSSTFKTQALHVCTCNFFFFFLVTVEKLGRESILIKMLLQNSPHTKMNPQGRLAHVTDNV